MVEKTTYRIERISSLQGINALQEGWSRLLDEVPDAPVFLTWEWISTWCRHLEPDWDLWLLAAWDGDGHLAGLAPWTLSPHRYGPLTIRRLAFMGSNYAYRTHQDIIAPPHRKAEITRAFMDFLLARRRQWDVLDLEALSEGSEVRTPLAGMPGLRREQEPIPCPYTPLPPTWEEYEMKQLSANRRQQLRARRRKLERDAPAPVSFERVREIGELPAAMDALIALHRKRWHGRGQASSFDIPSFEAFHRELAAVALDRDWLRLYLLKAGEEVIAAEYCFLFRGVLFDYQKGFNPDPAWERYSPGQLVLAFALQDAIGDGAHEFDMARGLYDYKVSWTDRERVDSHVTLSISLHGHMWNVGGSFLRWAKANARQVLPDGVRRQINRMLSPARARQGEDQAGSPAGASQPGGLQ